MADVKWTDAQLDAIEARGENILVSAAAGSGKTAVLVERVIRMITRKENPMDIDRLVVMTFTKAAANQMKNKIYKALKAKIAENPDNIYLRQQLMKVQGARICTIDSLCYEIVRDNFHAADLDPSFRIADTAEIKMLKKDVLQEVIEEEYRKASPSFMNFVEYYVDKNDVKLEEIILKLHEFAESHPEPEIWLRACTLPYINAGRLFENAIDYPEGMENWMGIYKEIVDNKQREIKDMAEKGLEISLSNHGPWKYEPLFKDIADLIDRITDQPLDFRSPEIKQYLENWAKAPSIGKKDTDIDEALKNQAMDLRKSIKKNLEDLRDEFLYADMDALCNELDACKDVATAISDVTIKFSNKFKEAKKERLIADFADIAHYTLKILIEYDENGRMIRNIEKAGDDEDEYIRTSPVYTEIADAMAAGIDEIIVDEYQDTNMLQEEMVKALSSERFGKPNVFMVGDVKQSIYGFRMACPDLFIRKMNDYMSCAAGEEAKYGEKGRLIVLDRNFRSRREVLDVTNLIFRQAMIPSVGKIDYKKDNHDLVYGGLFGEKTSTDEKYIPEIYVIESSGELGKTLEAYEIADKIGELTGTGEFRYSDIAILTRTTDNPQLEQLLHARGIPVIKNSARGFFDSFEIRLTLNLLSIIDNPYQDIPLTAVLYSPVCNASANDLAHIRIAGKGKADSIYESLTEAVGENAPEGELKKKLGWFLRKLNSWRQQASYVGLYDFVEFILKDSGMNNIVSAMPDGKNRKANLEFLKNKVHAFSKGSYTGLFSFIRYINELMESDIDFGTVNAQDAEINAVQMMTVHKSKGLEFPVVFVSGTGKKYNEMDLNNSVIADKTMGLGLEYRNTQTRIINKTALMQTMRYKQKKELFAEEMRLLYVAFTRAKEKLIITGTCISLDSALKNWERKIETDSKYMSRIRAEDEADIRYECIDDYKIMEAGSFIKLTGLALHSLKERSSLFSMDYLLEEDVEIQRAEEVYDNLEKEEMILKTSGRDADISDLTGQFAYRYPFAKASLIQGKITASQLENKDYEVKGTENSKKRVIPKSIYGEDQILTGAERGNAYHRFFELMDYGAFPVEGCVSGEELKQRVSEQLKLFMEQGKMTKAQVITVEEEKICSFLCSETGRRMAAAAAKSLLFREQQFVMGYVEDINAIKTVTGPDTAEENPVKDEELLLVQGIIDAFFVEKDSEGRDVLILVDYKTDKNKDPEHFINTYTPQLNAYRDALVRSKGMKVAQRILYSIEMDREIILKDE